MMVVADKAAQILKSGGVIAYPTEGVFGLGCLPTDDEAVQRLLAIKQRAPSKGLILLAASASQFGDWISLPASVSLPAPVPDKPITWVVPAGERANDLIRGDNAGIAVRITTNPVALAICKAVGSPIVSTSANLSGQAVASNQSTLRRQFGSLVDYIVPGPCGPSAGPSEVRDLLSGDVLRPRKQ
jgi:L-threonylcarbamoyladenylate synthase